MRILTLSMILIGLFQSTAYAELTLLKEQLFTESEESIQRRTYSYDFDVSPQGIVHAIYSKPVPNKERGESLLLRKLILGIQAQVRSKSLTGLIKICDALIRPASTYKNPRGVFI